MYPTIHSGRDFLANIPGGVYGLLMFMNAGLVVDVGAAAGGSTCTVKKYSPASRVIAFEPFPGNWPYFKENTKELSNVTFHRVALADSHGKMSFFVPATVSGTEKSWEKMIGYSSGGRLVVGALENDPRTIQVDVFTLDEIVKDHIRLVKLDVQGGERGVMKGAQNLLEADKIDMIYTEFSGDEELLTTLIEYDFIVFDDEYIVSPRTADADLTEWDIIKPIALSSGATAYRVWPRVYPRHPDEYARWLANKRPEIRAVQTDLLCVKRRFLPEVLMSASRSLQIQAREQIVPGIGG